MTTRATHACATQRSHTRARLAPRILLAVMTSWISCAASADHAMLTFLEQRVSTDPLDSVALARLSLEYMSAMHASGNLDYLQRAEAAARGSLLAVPAERNAEGLKALAMARYEAHHFKEALQLARQAQSLAPSSQSVALLISDVQFELGDYAGTAQTLAELAPGKASSALMTRQARLAEARGNTDQAIALLSALASGGDDSLRVHLQLSELHFGRGELEQTEVHLLTALRYHPDSLAVQEHLAELRAAQRRFAEAEALYRQLIARMPRPESMHALGDLLMLLKRSDEARQWQQRALAGYLRSTAQGNARFYHQLVRFFCDSVPNREQALRWARADLQIRSNIHALEGLAWALYKNGSYQEAADAMDRALVHRTGSATLLYQAGLIYSYAGRAVAGRKLLQQASAINPLYDNFHVHR